LLLGRPISITTDPIAGADPIAALPKPIEGVVKKKQIDLQ
jgi:hypothetical protein